MIQKFWFLWMLGLAIINNSFAVDTLSLKDCIPLAKENNLKLAQSKSSVEQAQTGIMDAKSVYYPDLNLSSSYSYGDEQVGEGNYSTGLTAKYTLFKGGYNRAVVKIAEARLKVAEENYRLEENDVVLAVKEAFFQILQKQEQITLINDILKRRKENLIIIGLKYDVGRESSPAVKEAEVDLLKAEYDKMKAEKEIKLAKGELNLLIGRSRGEELYIKYGDEDIKFPPLEEMIEEARTERPEICSEMYNREIYEAQITQAKSNYFPTLSLSSSYGLRGSKFLEQEPNWSVGANISLNIFNGFSNQAKVKEANLLLKEKDIKIQEVKNSIEEEVENTWVDWEMAERNLQVSNKALEAAQEMYQLTRLQYEQGLTSYFFLQQKETALTNAEYNYVNALYNLRTARARLQKVWGRRNQ